MNYHDYRPYDMLNGDGVRATLFLSGCEHGCKGCYNTETWSEYSGVAYTPELEERIIRDLRGEDGVRRKGLTLTGGDPLHPANAVEVLALIEKVREECPDKDIWLWTGYTKEELEGDWNGGFCFPIKHTRIQIISEVDYLIDGKYDKDLKDETLRYRGSSNQNVYHNLERIL